MTTTQRLANYISSAKFEKYASNTHEIAIDCVFDALISAIAGLNEHTVLGTQKAVEHLFGEGEISLWFSNQTSTAAGALLYNSTAAAVLDLDDGHAEARGHPGSAVIPAVLAAAQEVKPTWEEVICAIIVGYEVGVRIKAARGSHGQPNEHGQSGVWVGFAVVAALGSLYKLSPKQISHALAMVGVNSPNLIATGYTKDPGSDVKEGIPWATLSGIQAVRLAEQNILAFEDILDHEPFYNAADILRELGEIEPKICAVYFKPYSTCRHIHPPIRALEELMVKHDISPEDIHQIEVNIFDYALRLSSKTDPENMTDIQYSIPYCMAITAIEGVDALLPIEDALLHRPDLIALAKKVSIIGDVELSKIYPDEARAFLVITTHDGKYKSPVTAPFGSQDDPISLRNKFTQITKKSLTQSQQHKMLDAIDKFNNGDLFSLLEILSKPMLDSA